MNRGIHTAPNQGRTQTWLSPPDLVERLGPFDLDPCCPAWMPWRTAGVMLTRDPWPTNPEHPTVQVDDGVRAVWDGRVWLNPPYSAAACAEWLSRLADHGDGVALVASRTETEWWHRAVWDRAGAVLFIEGRLHYHYADGARAVGNAGHGSALVAYGPQNVVSLELCGLRGRLVHL